MTGDQTSILAVEDDPQILKLIQLVLGKEGYDVLPAGSGEEALDLLRDNDPALVLLDNRLPGMDGFTTCHHIRKFSDVPIIMVTAMDQLGDKILGIEIGADCYVTKPFLPNELVARVKAVLRRSTMPQQSVANGHNDSITGSSSDAFKTKGA